MMIKSTNVFFVTSLFGVMILISVAIYFYQVRQNFQEFKNNFQENVGIFKQQAINPDTIIHLQVNEIDLAGDYARIEHLMTKYFKRSLDFENKYRQQKNDLKINSLFSVAHLKQDPSLAIAEANLNRADFLFIAMYQDKSQMFDQLLIDANQIELSTHKRTDQFHQNFDQFFTQYVKTQEQILNLEKHSLALKRDMLHVLKDHPWKIENDQLVFQDSVHQQKFQQLQTELLQTHMKKIDMQEKALVLFLMLYS